jgi:hypothetical protein
MERIDITKQNIVSEMLRIIPELKETYEAEIDWWGVEFPGYHNIFGNVFNPYLEKIQREFLVSNKRKHKEIIERLFAFINLLSLSEDDDVLNVLMVTILAKIGDYTEILESSYSFMSKETRKLSDEVEKFYGRI